MAKFLVVEGPPGQGKSLSTARTTRELLERNKKWHEKGHPLRPVVANIKFSEAFETEWGEALKYWINTSELVKLRDCDIVWDEIATELDSRNWPNLDVETRRFLSQYRKRGIEIYANTQDFSMIDNRARLMITGVTSLSKAIGSPDPSATKPPVKRPWGIIFEWTILNHKEVDPDKKQVSWIPGFFFIRKKDIEIYDTTQDIQPGELPPLRHVVRKCEHFADPGHTCKYCKVVHL